MKIHPSAVIDPSAELGEGVEVGPGAVIGARVRVGARTRIGPHACLLGPLDLGEECVISFSAAVGHDPQVKGNPGPFGGTRIGSRNVIREFAQVHRSMRPEGETLLGDDNYMMAGSHIAHDCVVGNHVVMCNGVALAGHVTVQDRVFFGGGAMVHQFARVGELAMVGGMAAPSCDVTPFALVVGARPARVMGINTVGLKRAGVSPASRLALREAYRLLFRSFAPLSDRLTALDPRTPEVARLIEFIRGSRRGIVGGSVE